MQNQILGIQNYRSKGGRSPARAGTILARARATRVRRAAWLVGGGFRGASSAGRMARPTSFKTAKISSWVENHVARKSRSRWEASRLDNITCRDHSDSRRTRTRWIAQRKVANGKNFPKLEPKYLRRGKSISFQRVTSLRCHYARYVGTRHIRVISKITHAAHTHT